MKNSNLDSKDACEKNLALIQNLEAGLKNVRIECEKQLNTYSQPKKICYVYETPIKADLRPKFTQNVVPKQLFRFEFEKPGYREYQREVLTLKKKVETE